MALVQFIIFSTEFFMSKMMIYEKSISRVGDFVRKNKVSLTLALLVALSVVPSLVSAGTGTPSIAASDIGFEDVAYAILDYISYAVAAALLLFGLVQGIKIGIQVFKSVARSAAS
jgi:hypothetical protein